MEKNVCLHLVSQVTVFMFATAYSEHKFLRVLTPDMELAGWSPIETARGRVCGGALQYSILFHDVKNTIM